MIKFAGMQNWFQDMNNGSWNGGSQHLWDIYWTINSMYKAVLFKHGQKLN